MINKSASMVSKNITVPHQAGSSDFIVSYPKIFTKSKNTVDKFYRNNFFSNVLFDNGLQIFFTNRKAKHVGKVYNFTLYFQGNIKLTIVNMPKNDIFSS